MGGCVCLFVPSVVLLVLFGRINEAVPLRVHQRQREKIEQSQKAKHIVDQTFRAKGTAPGQEGVGHDAAGKAGLGRKEAQIEESLRERRRNVFRKQTHGGSFHGVGKDKQYNGAQHVLRGRIVRRSVLQHDEATQEGTQNGIENEVAIFVNAGGEGDHPNGRQDEQPQRGQEPSRQARWPVKVKAGNGRRRTEHQLQHEFQEKDKENGNERRGTFPQGCFLGW